MTIYRQRLTVLWFMLCIAVGAALSRGAEVFVGPSATGSGTGADLSNLQAWSGTLSRGNTYKLIGGSYNSRSFSTSASGSTKITITSLSSADSGITGYASWMTTQAVINAPLTFSSPHWTIYGRGRIETNAPASWLLDEGYSIKIVHAGQKKLVNYETGANYVWMTNIFVMHDSNFDPVDGDYTFNAWHTGFDPAGVYRTNLVWSGLGTKYGQNTWFIKPVIDFLIEKCAHSLGHGDSLNAHGEVINCYYYSVNGDIRWNYFKDEYLGGGCTAIIATVTGSRNLRIYGNVVDNFRAGDAVFGYDATKTDNVLVYHNTIANCEDINAGFKFNAASANSEARNNLIYNYNAAYMSGLSNNTHNAFSSLGTDGGRDAGSSSQTTITSSYFSNYAGGDLRLAIPTAAAIDVGAPYNIDMFGNVNTNRGAFAWLTGPTNGSSGGSSGPVFNIGTANVTNLRIGGGL